MTEIKEMITKNVSWFYMGGALSYFANIDVIQWEFYAITIPVIILNVGERYINDHK